MRSIVFLFFLFEKVFVITSPYVQLWTGVVTKNPQTVVYTDGKVFAYKICCRSTVGAVDQVVRTGI